MAFHAASSLLAPTLGYLGDSMVCAWIMVEKDQQSKVQSEKCPKYLLLKEW
jgi:hypothetical protein